MDGMIGSIPPSPELLAAVDALPPANDRPKVDIARARSGDSNFTLRKLLKPLAIALVAGLVLDGLDTAANLALPALVRGGIDNGVVKHAMSAVLAITLAGVGIVFADWLVNRTEALVVGRNGERLLFSLRVKIFAQLQRLGLDYYERELSGRIMTRMTSDVDALSSFLQTGLVTMISSLLTFVGVLIAMLVINIQLGLYVLAIIPVLVVATVVFRLKSAKAYSEARERVSVVNADLAENVAGLRVTQAFRREGENRSRFADRSFGYRQSRLRAQKYISLYFPFVQTLSTIAGTVVLVAAVGQVRSGAMTAGALIAYLLYIDMVFAPVQQLSQVFDGYQQAAVSLSRIKDLLRLSTTVPPAASPVPVPARGLAGRIELRDVRFSYAAGPVVHGKADAVGAEVAVARAKAGATAPTASPDVLRNVSFTISPGETVALVGQTGAGKSTIVKLIARFYDVTGGAVLIDGVDVRSYDLTSYRHRLGVVPQESYLFSGTVASNIGYTRPDAPMAEIAAAARAVGAHEMIAKLTDGYDHEVSERGRNLSAGQRQLIALARAQLADPDILLLDEATAALDLQSEAAVTRATRQLAAARTTIVVAHRLTTAARADRIIVMDHGEVAETGTHSELLDREGVYAGLWEAFVGDTEYAALPGPALAPLASPPASPPVSRGQLVARRHQLAVVAGCPGGLQQDDGGEGGQPLEDLEDDQARHEADVIGVCELAEKVGEGQQRAHHERADDRGSRPRPALPERGRHPDPRHAGDQAGHVGRLEDQAGCHPADDGQDGSDVDEDHGDPHRPGSLYPNAHKPVMPGMPGSYPGGSDGPCSRAPPSIGYTPPVMKLPASEASSSARPRISEGSPIRPSGITAFQRSSAAALVGPPPPRFVLKGPGAMALTRTFHRARSCAACLTRLTTPALAIA
jgi:ATP-binding cassette subfamily B protein